MDHHLMHNPPVQWGYSGTPPHNTWVPPPTRGVKRTISESDCDDAYSETSSKDQTSPKDTDSCQHLTRKKRRGVIEKKRRDRINSSLTELKRLVPSAYEKQGSAKLEKAEILQLTVDHLKMLHAKGVDSLTYDPQRFAMDYHIIGFRECASEVARYLINIEGMDIQDPLRMRLMSHLQCFVAQREVSTKTGAPSPTWSHSSYQPNYTSSYHQNYPTTHVPASGYLNIPPPLSATAVPALPLQHHTATHTTTTATAVSSQEQTTDLLRENESQQQQQQQQHNSHHHHHEQQQQQQVDQQQQQQQHHHYSNTLETHQDHQEPTYTDLTSIQRNSAPSIGYGNPQYPSTGAQGYGNSAVYNPNHGSKPYRPWGAEMAY